ncbi:MAG: hypothetical protein IKI35_04725 [Stomatobaculum sp.]|nr:hypothetical protein [Stomatobaculum sp.]
MKHGRRISLAVKINLLIIAAILVVAAGLVGIGYRAYGKRIDDIFVTETMRYSTALADYLNPTVLEHFQKEVMSEEYQEVRNRAEAAGDAAIAEKWMAERPGGDPSRDQSLLDDYNELAYILDYYCETYGVDEAYFQMDKDEVTWNIISAYKVFYGAERPKNRMRSSNPTRTIPRSRPQSTITERAGTAQRAYPSRMRQETGSSALSGWTWMSIK